MKPPPMPEYPILHRFRHQPHCAYCGARNPLLMVNFVIYQWDLPPLIYLQCKGGCAVLQRTKLQSRDAWEQTCQWRFGIPYGHTDRVIYDLFIFTMDADRCDFCGKTVIPGKVEACVKRARGKNHWLHYGPECKQRAVDFEDRSELSDPPEPPEFPVYVGWDGKEHGEF